MSACVQHKAGQTDVHKQVNICRSESDIYLRRGCLKRFFPEAFVETFNKLFIVVKMTIDFHVKTHGFI